MNMLNKQALELAKRWLKDIEGVKSPTSLLASVALSEIETIESQYPLGSTTSDSDRLREALEKIVDILCDDTSLTAQRINNVIIHALSTTTEPTKINLADTDVKGSVEFKRRSWEQSEPTGAERVSKNKCNHCQGTGIHTQDGFCWWCNGTGINIPDNTPNQSDIGETP